MYGVKVVGNLYGSAQPSVNTRFKVKANTTINKGDLVNLESGYIDVAGATEKIFGVANQTVTGNAGATTEIDIIVARPGDLYLMDNDNVGTTFAVTHPGTYFDTVATSGAQQVDTSSTTTTGQLLCLEYNPKGFGMDSDTSIGLFTPAECQVYGRAA